MIPDLSNIAVCRRWAREVQASRCFFPDVPTRTFETIPGPASAGSPELMIYRPSHADGQLPVYVNLHGGGLITAEYDVLCAEGDAYAGRLADAGVPTKHHSYAGCGHAFTHVGPADAAIDAWTRMVRFLERVFA